ncbi:MAG: hypothetical protein OXR68_07520 [Alphaproteobacteria bacterium]|nr:hypothetical protein [Alphaproteobacteria bacterium]
MDFFSVILLECSGFYRFYQNCLIFDMYTFIPLTTTNLVHRPIFKNFLLKKELTYMFKLHFVTTLLVVFTFIASPVQAAKITDRLPAGDLTELVSQVVAYTCKKDSWEHISKKCLEDIDATFNGEQPFLGNVSILPTFPETQEGKASKCIIYTVSVLSSESKIIAAGKTKRCYNSENGGFELSKEVSPLKSATNSKSLQRLASAAIKQATEKVELLATKRLAKAKVVEILLFKLGRCQNRPITKLEGVTLQLVKKCASSIKDKFPSQNFEHNLNLISGSTPLTALSRFKTKKVNISHTLIFNKDGKFLRSNINFLFDETTDSTQKIKILDLALELLQERQH